MSFTDGGDGFVEAILWEAINGPGYEILFRDAAFREAIIHPCEGV